MNETTRNVVHGFGRVFASLISSSSAAGDFEWIKDFNIRAEADPSGFRARLAARFNIGNIQIKAVLGNVEDPQMPIWYYVLENVSKANRLCYREIQIRKGKRWGALAQRLLDQGSEEFHALKRGNDFYNDNDKGKAKIRVKAKAKTEVRTRSIEMRI